MKNAKEVLGSLGVVGDYNRNGLLSEISLRTNGSVQLNEDQVRALADEVESALIPRISVDSDLRTVLRNTSARAIATWLNTCHE